MTPLSVIRELTGRVVGALTPLGLLLFENRPSNVRLSDGSQIQGRPRRLLVDVTRASNSESVSGIERVTRELSLQLSTDGEVTREFDVVFFEIDYFGRFLRTALKNTPGQPSQVDVKREQIEFRNDDTVLFLDLSLPPLGPNTKDIQVLRSHCLTVVGFVYDVLPLTLPRLFRPGKSAVFAQWLRSISHCHRLLFISGTAEAEAKKVAARIDARLPTDCQVIPLGSKFSASHPVGHQTIPKPDLPKAPRFIAIGTIEPRKGYGLVLDAFELLWDEGIDAELIIAGRPGWRSESLIRRLENHPESGKRFSWEPNLDDAQLSTFLMSSHALLALSIDEGFGLPILEARTVGLPVLARDIPVFRELFPEINFIQSPNAATLSLRIKKLIPLLGRLRGRGASLSSWTDSARSLMAAVQAPVELS